MCYVAITSKSLVWFLLSIIADMLILTAIVTPNWLIAAKGYQVNANHTNQLQYPSVGIYSRCKIQGNPESYTCGTFDLNSFATSNYVYPLEWKAAMFFMSLGFWLLTTTVVLTLLSCCRQSLIGKSIHNITGSAQVVAGISTMMALFLHPLGWGESRVQKLCGQYSEPFYPGDCRIGSSLYFTVAGVLLCFLSAIQSLKAESANLKLRVRRRIENGECLVCVL